MEIKLHKGVLFNGNIFSNVEDVISIEVPLSISINDIPFTITMQTPGNEFDLARGLLFSENIFRSQEYKPLINVVSKNEHEYITSVNFVVPKELILKDFAGTRNVISASSCGVCGKTSLDDLEWKVVNNEVLFADYVPKMFEQVSAGQNNFIKSGGTHAAGAFTIDGQMLSLKEDIGRHNAVDKVIGYLVANNLLDKTKCITVSGRISYEIVNKIKSAGIPFLAAISAPSTLAIDMAQESGITLMAFCRNEKFTIYSNPQQVVIKDKFDVNTEINLNNYVK